MAVVDPLLYVPALRAKAGEIKGLQRLAPDVSSKIKPHLIIPPPKDIDPEKQRQLTQDEIVYGTGRKIAEHWPLREAFLDVRFLFKEFGVDSGHDWLQRMFDVARHALAKPIPVMTIAEALGPQSHAYKKILANGPTKVVIRINFDEVDSEIATRLAAALSAMEIKDEDCVLLADFAEADFSDPSIVGEIAQGVLESLQDIGRWKAVVFQGSNYPIKNPAADNGSFEVSRNEWLAWKAAVKLNGSSPDHLIFGDYGADCAKIEFKKKGGGIPIRHYRYTTPSKWLVVRGVPSGAAKDIMRQVCNRVLNSGYFAGREFSSADDFIYKSAQGWEGPGNGTTWREINTTHHITRVVRDIGEIKGYNFIDRQVSSPSKQDSMFDFTGVA
ncbi:beta family protein [Methylorubrum thiocyanatum]|uniref:beta family protein n=1 Tax=Methylorubrum thiocyanatum TaxID=47958 RepID=UPI00398C3C6D